MLAYTASIIEAAKTRFETRDEQKALAERLLIELDIFQAKEDIIYELTLIENQMQIKFGFYKEIKFNQW